MNTILYKLYSIRPALEECWEKARLGSFTNELPEKLSKAHLEIQKLLDKAPDRAMQLRVNALSRECDRVVTAREFLSLIFRLNLDELDHRCDEIPQQIKRVLDEAEEALLRHVVRSVNSNAAVISHGGAYRLRMSGIISSRSKPDGTFPMLKAEARFLAENFEAEFAAAGVPSFYYEIPGEDNEYSINELFNALPRSVKELFFSTNYRGKLRNDLPLYLLRDIFLFVDDERWEKLKSLSASDNKKQYLLEINKLIQEFLMLEREWNGVSLGAARRSRKRQPVDANGRVTFNPREQALVELWKPYKWILKSRAAEKHTE